MLTTSSTTAPTNLNNQKYVATDDIATEVELSISCNQLPNLDVLSKTDPQVFIFTRDATNPMAPWTEIGRTEIIWDNLNPKFVTTFVMKYRFETNQYLKFVVVDIDNERSKKLEDQELVGEMYCTLAEVVGSKGGRLMKPLIHPQLHNTRRGFIAIRAEEVQKSNQLVTFKISVKNLDSKNWFFGKSDPFLVITRGGMEEAEFAPVYKSEYYLKTLNTSFKSFQISAQKLCNGDFQRQIRLEVYDWNRSGNHELIGWYQTTLDELIKQGNHKSYLLINPELKKKKKGYIGSGNIIIDSISVEKAYSFLDYVRGGYQISLIAGIDFTASNGDPNNSQSLHYRSANYLNDYQKAILSVGEILSYYDSDKKFPVYGFGGKIPPRYEVSHCFPANMNWNNPEVEGVQGILNVYNYAMSTVQLYGPTYFAPLINTAASFARRDAETTYFILLILTDGEICDMPATTDAIVEASTLPLSIIIVGIGNANFGNMDVLDADETPLVSSRGVKMSRDIVQFVPFNNFKNAHPSVLAQQVLQEVPNQFLSYMKQHNILPKNPIQVESFYGTPSMARMDSSSNNPNSSAFKFNNGQTDYHQQQSQTTYPQQPPYPTTTNMQQPQPSQPYPPQGTNGTIVYDLNGLPKYTI
ncbi:hypothetical protein C9374_008073 [Naegleria lovaniensis]|uniref:C2 domain-containing protein n=1 Tax=Naegleria lovaniensis TaxID=51637 RepID=A0AA88KL30_NAELO|nr:uncharacterized protein C9374_008073 [Naegleria lovaniensis]KAG2378434.1 hypothetical protein C9374_008073 [Naegleria lovaniensis]